MGTCYNKIEINSPIMTVWETIKDFHDLSWAPDVITSLKTVGDKAGKEVGAKRLLNDAFPETLTSLDSENFTFEYSIDDGPGPVAKDAVNNYIGVVKMSELGGGTLMEWSSSFESDNSEDVTEFCDPIYQALLQALKQTLS